MTDPIITETLERFDKRKNVRGQWETHWQELAELMRPRRADFTVSSEPGAKRTHEQFDSAPMLAARGLAVAVGGLLTPKSERWFSLKAADEALNDDDEVKAWIDLAEKRLLGAIYDPHARFVKAFATAYLDLVTLGTAIVFMGERADKDGLVFRPLHLKDTYIATNAEGAVDTMFLVERLTAPQAARRFGPDKLAGRTREASNENDRETEFDFLQAVTPRDDAAPGRLDAPGLPFAARVIDIDAEAMMDDSGYHEFPFAVLRWDTDADEDYGRSPGMLALPDAKTLMQMGKTMLESGHKAVDPPWFAPSDSISSAPRTFPGGITYYDADALAGAGGQRAIFPAISGANFPLGREMQRDTREQIWSAFFKNVLNLPVDGPQMTATEVLERKQEFMRTVGPTLGQLEPDGPAVITTRSFSIMQRAGALPPAPESLISGVSFTYGSTIERVAKQIEAAALPRAIEIMGPLVQANPDMLDHLDTDAIARDVPEAVGLPQRWLRPLAEVERRRGLAAQAQQAQLALAGADQVAGIASKLPPDQLAQLSDQLAKVVPGLGGPGGPNGPAGLGGQFGPGGSAGQDGSGGVDLAALMEGSEDGDLLSELDDDDEDAAMVQDAAGKNAPGPAE